jgi:hypothetical protein
MKHFVGARRAADGRLVEIITIPLPGFVEISQEKLPFFGQTAKAVPCLIS